MLKKFVRATSFLLIGLFPFMTIQAAPANRSPLSITTTSYQHVKHFFNTLEMALLTPFHSLKSSSTSNQQKIQALAGQKGLPPQLLTDGLKAFAWAKAHGDVTKNVLTIADLGQDSKYKRLWVINLNTDTVVAHTFVANGKNSGLYRGTTFSNKPGSDQSSLGVYVTGHTFVGNDGYSLRLQGLEKGINSNAYQRDIVVHPAWYVGKSFAQKYNRVGQSWGCFALSKKMAPKVINLIKGGSVLFAYATQEKADPNLDLMA